MIAINTIDHLRGKFACIQQALQLILNIIYKENIYQNRPNWHKLKSHLLIFKKATASIRSTAFHLYRIALIFIIVCLYIFGKQILGFYNFPFGASRTPIGMQIFKTSDFLKVN